MGTKTDSPIKRKLSKSHWNLGLINNMKDPKLIVLEDDLTVSIKDLYPKAEFHYLVCPKEDINTLNNVRVEHLNLLKHMHEVGKKLSANHKERNFLIGYHSIPSMLRLHLHVVSDDFNSPCLKTKKHWNSFTTEYFLSSEKVIEDLEKNEKIIYKTVSELKSLIDQPLKCHKCDYKPKHMPDLKYHLKTHLPTES